MHQSTVGEAMIPPCASSKDFSEDDERDFESVENKPRVVPDLDRLEKELERGDDLSIPRADLYALLNVERGSSEAEIKDAYRRLCVQFHPDKQPDKNLQDLASLRFQKIQYAYSVLSDPEKRTIYDTYGVDAVETFTKRQQKNQMQVGHKLKTPAEVKAEYELLALQKRALDINSLVKSSGEISLTLDLSRREAAASQQLMKLVKQADGSYLPQPIDKAESNSSSSPVSIPRAFVKHGWKYPISKSTTGQLTGTVVAIRPLLQQRYNAALDINFGVRKNWTSRLCTDTALTVGAMPALTQTLIITPNDKSFVSLSSFASWPFRSPLVQAMYGRQITESLSGHFLLKGGPGSMWFRSSQVGARITRQFFEERKDDSSPIKSKGEMSLDLSGGFEAASATASVLWRDVYDNVHGKFSLGFSETRGVFCKVNFEKECFSYTRIGFGAEVSTAEGTMWRISLRRLGQKLSIPVLLVPEFDLVKFGLALGFPVGLALAFDILYWKPRMALEYEKRLERAQEKYKDVFQKQRDEAEETQRLLLSSATKKYQQELSQRGLVILKAYYGVAPFPAFQIDDIDLSKYPEDFERFSAVGRIMDATVVLCSMVTDSQLYLGSYPKSSLLGFYDVAFGKEKSLEVYYLYRDVLHYAKFKDGDRVALPLKVHMVKG